MLHGNLDNDETVDFRAKEDGGEMEVLDEGKDDERTLELEEKRTNKKLVQSELNEISREAELDFDEFLSKVKRLHFNCNNNIKEFQLPSGYLEALGYNTLDTRLSADRIKIDNPQTPSSSSSAMDESKSTTADETPSTASASIAESVRENGEKRVDDREKRRQKLTSIAEVAQELQPKGYTLETTHVNIYPVMC